MATLLRALLLVAAVARSTAAPVACESYTGEIACKQAGCLFYSDTAKTVCYAGDAAGATSDGKDTSSATTSPGNAAGGQQTNCARCEARRRGKRWHRTLATAPTAPGKLKILCLHGGGGTGAGFRSAAGMQALAASLGDKYEFVFPDGGSAVGAGNLWIRDPPNGKGQSTTDPNFAAPSFAVLDKIVRDDGPFYGILGYSQGSAFIPVYLSHVPAGTFKVAFMFCGYLTTTHQGLLGEVNTASPFGGIPALVWQGARDGIITNGMTAEQATKFTSPTVVTSSTGDHAVPSAGDPTYDAVVAFMSVANRRGDEGTDGTVIGEPSTGTGTDGKGTGTDGKDTGTDGKGTGTDGKGTGTDGKGTGTGGKDTTGWVCNADGHWYETGAWTEYTQDCAGGDAKDDGGKDTDGEGTGGKDDGGKDGGDLGCYANKDASACQAASCTWYGSQWGCFD